MARKKFLNDLEDFVKDYIEKGKVNERKKKKILNETIAWNKEDVVKDLLKRIDEHRLYEEEQFPYQYYIDKLLQEPPIDLTNENK